MNFINIIFIAIGLAMDATAVSITQGVITKAQRLKIAFQYAFSFSVFQMLMPILGWWLGSQVSYFLQKIDHWIAFILLFFIGSKMIYESFKLNALEDDKKSGNSLWVLFILSIATSIDAFAVGLTFAFLNVALVIPILIIGLITFVFSIAGFFIGERLGHVLENKIEIFGGLFLIGIGLKILIEHLFFM